MNETPTQGPAIEFKRRPKEITPRFLNIMEGLRAWRSEDHEDNIALGRSTIIEIIEGVDALTEKCGNVPE